MVRERAARLSRIFRRSSGARGALGAPPAGRAQRGSTGREQAGTDSADTARELARAARILAIRSRREATGLFAGGYASAFRGGGMEFEESRPYVPGDDVRAIDWNAMSRTGEPWVKRYREERDRQVMIALDVSASMAFGTTGRSQAFAAAHAAALLAAAAGRAGDRVGLVSFDETVRRSLRPASGAPHTWRVVEAAVAEARAPRGATDLGCAAETVQSLCAGRSVVFLLSDFRHGSEPGRTPAWTRPLQTLGHRHDLVSIVLFDPRDDRLPDAGMLRLEDPERPGRTLLLDSSSETLRTRYSAAARQRRGALERELQRAGSDVLWLRGDRDPLHALSRFFFERAARHRVGAR